jgi:DNA-binding CsgD family transcriptional regulator
MRNSVGVETVRSYRKTMMKKLNVNNVAALIRVALAAGLASKIQQGAPGH